MVENELNEALESLALLRIQALKNDPKNKALRASFRGISLHLENVQQLKPVALDECSRLVSWLGMFLDANFGTRIRHYNKLSDSEREALNEHINSRKDMVLQAEHSVPKLQMVLSKCLITLNQSPDANNDIEKQARQLARALKNHMQDDNHLRKALNALIATMQESLGNIVTVLSDIDEESPELDETKAILEQELPDDPKAARQLLQKARENIIKAGKRVSQAGQSIQQTMEEQKTQMLQMSENLNRAEFDANHDSLTGLGNRRKLAEFFNTLGAKPATFLLLDIDHFKKVNDRYGHNTGDEILVALAERLSANVRASDLVVRLGGEEFGAVLPEVPAEHAFEISETLRQAIGASDIKHTKGKLPITVSIGLATRKPGESVAHWIARADKALYGAKNNGRNRTEVSLA
ncbi:MAG: diguanylate cyclase [Mariprofundaceae bacterium]